MPASAVNRAQPAAGIGTRGRVAVSDSRFGR